MRLFYGLLPYWVAGIGCYVPILMRRIDDRHSYSGSFLDSFGWATDSLTVAGIGFPFVAAVFFLWRPQSKQQLAFGVIVSLILFVGPAFQPRWQAPSDYVQRLAFRLDCAVVACCMVAAQIFPVALVSFTSFRLLNHLRTSLASKSVRRGVSVSELLFLTFCCAVCAALAMSVYREYDQPSLSHFRTKGVAPLAMCFGTSISVLMALQLHRYRGSSRVAVGFIIATLLLLASFASSYLSHYELFPDLSKAYVLDRVMYQTVAHLIVSGCSTIAFVGILSGIGYRIDTTFVGEPSDISHGY